MPKTSCILACKDVNEMYYFASRL